jgi:hypothetical protein
MNRALDLVVSLRPVTAAALFPSKDIPCVICGGQSVTM